MNSRNKNIFSNGKASFTFTKNQKTHASYLSLCSKFTNDELYLFIHLLIINITITLKIIYLHSQPNVLNFF